MNQPNHISKRLAVQMRLATAAKLAHSLDAEGRQGEWASEAACECLLARGAAVDKAAGCETRGAGGQRRGASKRDPYVSLRVRDPYVSVVQHV